MREMIWDGGPTYTPIREPDAVRTRAMLAGFAMVAILTDASERRVRGRDLAKESVELADFLLKELEK
jgi:hypothetical protein